MKPIVLFLALALVPACLAGRNTVLHARRQLLAADISQTQADSILGVWQIKVRQGGGGDLHVGHAGHAWWAGKSAWHLPCPPTHDLPAGLS